MSDYSGFIFIMDEAARAARIEEHISKDGTFTDTISVPDWQTKQAEIFFLSFDGQELSHAALARRGNNVATEKRLIRFTNLVKFAPPVPIKQIRELIDSRVRSYFVRSSSGTGKRVTPKTWMDFVNTVRQLRPESADDLSRLEQLRQLAPEYSRKRGIEVLAEEKDAVNLALRMSGFDDREVLKWSPPKGEELAPFLQSLRQLKINEDQMIAQDTKVFGGWERLPKPPVGAVMFRKGDERLTVMNVNRHKIENTLGVDLFYYHHRYNAYVMVQYKRMEREQGDMGYRPIGKSYEAELRRMREFEGIIAGAGNPLPFRLDDYRLHDGSSYFKLCPEEVFDPTSTDMIKGMYIPLDYWEMLMKSPHILGPKGGQRVTFDNARRYFNNTLFVNLVQLGLIGSKMIRTDALTEIAKRAIEGDRSAILASLQTIKRQTS